jgi:hypothetical protein
VLLLGQVPRIYPAYLMTLLRAELQDGDDLAPAFHTPQELEHDPVTVRWGAGR